MEGTYLRRGQDVAPKLGDFVALIWGDGGGVAKSPKN